MPLNEPPGGGWSRRPHTKAGVGKLVHPPGLGPGVVERHIAGSTPATRTPLPARHVSVAGGRGKVPCPDCGATGVCPHIRLPPIRWGTQAQHERAVTHPLRCLYAGSSPATRTVCPSLTPPGPATKPSANPTAKYGSPRHRRLGLRSVEHFRRRLPLLIRLQPHRTRPEQPRRPPVHLVPRTQQPQHHQLPHRPGSDSRLRGTHHQDGVIDRCWQTAISTRPINARSETIFSVPTLATLYQCRARYVGAGYSRWLWVQDPSPPMS